VIRSATTIKATVACVTLGLLASACAEDSIFGGGGTLSGFACPQVAILEGPGELTRFADGKTGNISDVLFQARMEVTGGVCDIEENKVFVTADIKLNVIRGPAETKREVKFTLFIGIIDSMRKIVSRHALPILIKFDGPERNFELEDSVTVEIDVAKNVDPATYSVYGGFEMTPEELEFNRGRQR
tara:strand:+ start:130 stop:684 length:555 start_codon:yes stop_codon:yes gene_type:complete